MQAYVGLAFTMLLEVFLCFVVAEAVTVDDEERLRKVLFQSYNTEVRPPYNLSRPLTIGAYLTLSAIHDVDDANGVLSSVVAFYLQWEDNRLLWNSSDYSGLEEISVNGNHIWLPKIYALNTAELKSLSSDTIITRLSHNGSVRSVIGATLRTNFDPRMTYFPYDTQICNIQISILGYYPHEVSLSSLLDKIETIAYIENNGWDLIGTKARPFAIGGYTGLIEFQIILRRRHLYFDINIIAPLTILTIVNPMVCFLPIDSGERVSFSVTMLLSFGVYISQISEDMPEVSDPIAFLSYFLVIVLVGSAFVTFTTIITASLYYKDEAQPVHTWVRVLISILSFQCFCILFRCCSRSKWRRNNEQVKKNNCDGDHVGTNTSSWQQVAKDLNFILFFYLWMCLVGLFTYAIIQITMNANEDLP